MMGVEVPTAGPYANHLHFATDRQPHQHHFLTGWMLFLVPNRVILVTNNKAVGITRLHPGNTLWQLMHLSAAVYLDTAVYRPGARDLEAGAIPWAFAMTSLCC